MAEIGFERPKGSVDALELLGPGVALMLDQHEIAYPRIGLPQRKALPFCKPDQDLARPVSEAAHRPGTSRSWAALWCRR